MIRGVAFELVFPMYSATTGLLLAGGSPSVQVSKDGGAFAASTNAAAGIANGYYLVQLTATEMNAQVVTVRAFATGFSETTGILETVTAFDNQAAADAVWETVTGGWTPGSFGAEVDDIFALATDIEADVDGLILPTFQAKVWVFDDNAAGVDRYAVAWFKNGESFSTPGAITVPTIQVVKVADGTDLIAQTAMTEIGALERYRYTEAVNRIVAGAAYLAIVTATIEAATRVWTQPIGRDST